MAIKPAQPADEAEARWYGGTVSESVHIRLTHAGLKNRPLKLNRPLKNQPLKLNQRLSRVTRRRDSAQTLVQLQCVDNREKTLGLRVSQAKRERGAEQNSGQQGGPGGVQGTARRPSPSSELKSPVD
ncbi:hypothetical protein NHX12_001621 [Muraenolepis orangiensis]|uniref:Uncharacterized protein n=1 Tax=Muraenolepis orangiensis TaxID=630683 RepID=A0A9Q0IF47_9TELE|nr:hypothetical protein NHX12_001621 [Muraenolepis orangiensis]